MTFLYLTFGSDLQVHQQAVFSAMSLLAKREAIRIVVMTDAPGYYGLLGDRATLHPLGPEVLDAWKGPHVFFWRIKIRALQTLADLYPGEQLIYLDADTFCFGSLDVLSQRLEGGTQLMHAREGALSELPTRTERKMWKQCAGKIYAGVAIDGDSSMYNAGVVALSPALAGPTLELALRICDEMCAAGVTRRLIEQFALSMALAARGRLAAANDTIGHYWGNKPGWNEVIRNFFIARHLEGRDLDAQIAAAGGVDFGAVPIYRRSSATQRKLRRWVDAAFQKMRFPSRRSGRQTRATSPSAGWPRPCPPRPGRTPTRPQAYYSHGKIQHRPTGG